MSDDEAAGGLNSLGDDSDLALPKATIAKYVSGGFAVLPSVIYSNPLDCIF